MIIVSQDKTKAINFKRLNYIQVSKVDENKSIIEINHSDCNYLIIAEYKTEERAKEVLAEIVQKYSSYLKLNGGPAILQGQMDIQPNIFNIPKVYEMPEK